ncbi:MAG TPA: hypothetical protein PK011_05635 [Marinagarivorans sp.]|nr:hypothetical protein [Cellvibrionaceae bacterium]HMY38786.1 hypothetical protein [Marinagarivorans sp.]
MSDNSQFVAESLAELLVAIAGGVREAQEALSQMPALDRLGRPMPSYHLPYLDFQLQVDMDSTQTESGARLLRVLPLANSQKTTSQQISSTLSGRFVAVPPGEGLPVPVLQLQAQAIDGAYQLNVQLTNSAGEALVGAAVELNLNQAASLQLSKVDGVNLSSLKNTRLQQALVRTDETGRAATRLEPDSSLPPQATLVVTAEYGQYAASISVAAGALS